MLATGLPALVARSRPGLSLLWANPAMEGVPVKVPAQEA